MKVLIIPSWYVTEDKPNNGIFFKEQAEALQSAGLNVTVAYADLRFNLHGLRHGIYRDYSANVPTYINRKRTLTPFWERGRWPQISKMLDELYDRVCMESGRPDIIHLHSCRIGVEALELCRKHNTPLVYTEHFSGVTNNVNKDLLYQFQKTLDGCTVPIAVSRDLRAHMVGQRPDTLLIPNLVDTSAFKINPNVTPMGGFVFASVGNLVPIKGYDVLIRAFARALPLMYGARLLIAGAGEQEQALKELIEQLNVQDSVQLVGFLPRKLAPKFYSTCDCFVCSSFSETFGVTLIEALSCGKPVISTRCGGPEDIIKNKKNGLLVKPGDIPEIAKALIFMSKNAAIFNPFSMREDCVKRFGKDYICQRIVQVYGYILQKKGLMHGKPET